MKLNNALSSIYVTADDFGMSPGINWAIDKALNQNLITNTSIVANGDCFQEAIKIAKSHKSGSYGLHFNLDYGIPVSDKVKVPKLLSSEGFLKNEFIKYLFIFLKKDKSEYKIQVEIELRAQIEKILENDITLDYIDSHRHIHAIPFVNKIVKKVGREYNIHRVRSYNESLIKTLFQARSFYILHPGKLLKWMVFKTLNLINQESHDTYFFSMLLSSILNRHHAKNLKVDHNYKSTEIMVHVGNPEIDKDFFTNDDLTNRYIRELERYSEYEFCETLNQNLTSQENG